jgi:hypothetical protein
MYDIYPLLQQFSMAQWVNFGFYVGFGHHQPYDFNNQDFIGLLANPAPEYREYRRQIFNYFRAPDATTIDPETWPWMYGDEVSIPAETPGAFLAVTPTLGRYLTQWVAGDYNDDWDPAFTPPGSVDAITHPQQQAEAINKAALWFCLGGPFHPGCEMTWPVRHTTMYSKPFRIRHRSPQNPEPDYGAVLSHADVMGSNGPLYYQGPGDLTRWMAVPWQTDTASCRAGYDKAYDPWLPTFWPARVPNHVLTERDYEILTDPSSSPEQRLAAFNTRASWYRILGDGYLTQVRNMIDLYGDLGVVEARPGIPNAPDFPEVIYVESRPGSPGGVPSDQVDEIPYDRGRFVGPVDKVRGKQ